MKVDHSDAASFTITSAGPTHLAQPAGALDDPARFGVQGQVPLQTSVFLIGEQLPYLPRKDSRLDEDHGRRPYAIDVWYVNGALNDQRRRPSRSLVRQLANCSAIFPKIAIGSRATALVWYFWPNTRDVQLAPGTLRPSLRNTCRAEERRNRRPRPSDLNPDTLA